MAQSGEEEIIIIGGGKGGKRSAVEVTVKPQGVQKVSTVLKQYSTWALAAILAKPCHARMLPNLPLLKSFTACTISCCVFITNGP